MVLKRIVPFFLVLILGLSLFGGQTVAIEAKKPVYTVGDFWKYNSTNSTDSLEETIRVVDTKVMIDGVSTTQLDTNSSVESMMGKLHTTGSIWARNSDLGIIKMISRSDFMGFKTEYEMNFTPAKKDFYYPLTLGKNWTFKVDSESTVRTSFPGSPPFENTTRLSIVATGKVMAQEKVTVPADTFDTFKIVVAGGNNETTYWYSWKVGAAVKVDDGTSILVLTDYNMKYPQGKPIKSDDGGGSAKNVETIFTTDTFTPTLLVLILFLAVMALIVALNIMKGGGRRNTVNPSSRMQGYQTPSRRLRNRSSRSMSLRENDPYEPNDNLAREKMY